MSWVYSYTCSVEIAIMFLSPSSTLGSKYRPRKHLGNTYVHEKVDVAGCECDVSVGWSREGVSSSQLRSEPLEGKKNIDVARHPNCGQAATIDHDLGQ